MKITTLGILGGGQLGRMSALAAARLGIRVVIFTDEDNAPASQVACCTVKAAYTDREALHGFADMVDFITYEFENIPLETVDYLRTLKPVLPNNRLLDVAQERIAEKSFLNSIGIPTARWAKIENRNDLQSFLNAAQGQACIVKTTRFGYDGKGQARIGSETNLDETLRNFKGQVLIAEEIVDFACEISVIVARDQFGKTVTYGPMLNEHRNHILSRTLYPAPVSQDIKDKAIAITQRLADALKLVGVLTLEMFVTRSGDILANEIAPRTHNSGHWTIDACAASQFENHVRAVCGLPVADPAPHHGVEMLNLIGDDVEKAASYWTQPNACVHLYSKTDALPGRKMGHVTILKDTL
ncbi:MAG: 5-(carboxyamino)imidazole ribonucleotide synthase [Alphaproteobacteria bacterium]|nr:5-(carboxyamino)imidazole ribonucleotide synthase [Alphaproteobacteria bacterium]